MNTTRTASNYLANKLPPKELEIEERIISSMLINDDYRKRICDLLDINDFYVSVHKVIFDKCREMGTNGHPIDISTLWAALDDDQIKIIGSQTRLAGLLDVPVATDIDYYISILKDQAARRHTIELVNSIQKRCDRKGSDLNKVVRDAKAIIEKIEGRSAGYQKSSFFIHNDQILENLKPIQWRIHDIMEENIIYLTFGDVGHYKTFFEIDRQLCIAAGKNYHGHPVKQGTVFYIAGEGQQGLGRRIAAWHIHNGTKAKDVPFFVAKTPTQLMDKGAIDEIKRTIDSMCKEYGPPANVHLDTLARNFGAGNENSTEDMSRVVQNIDLAFGKDIGVGITHHTGHMDKSRARGSIVLKAAIDAEYQIEYRAFDDTVLAKCTKMKDAPPAPPMVFIKKEIILDIDGQVNTSFAFELDAEGNDVLLVQEPKTAGLRQKQKDALAILNGLYTKYEKNLAASGRDSQWPNVSLSEWKEAVMGLKLYSRPDGFARAAETLLKRGHTILDEAGYYVYPIEIYNKYHNVD